MLQSAHITHRGGRETNQDALGVAEAGGIYCWAVADGVGGHEAGELASRAAVDAALASFNASPGLDAAVVRDCIAAADAAVVNAQANTQLASMRTTIVILLCDERQAVWGHLGDSRLYHFRGGRITFITRDDSVPRLLVDSGELTFAEIRHHADRSGLTRSIGSGDLARATVSTVVPVEPGDAFLLCSDGFWDFIEEPVMEEHALAAQHASAWLESMVAVLAERQRQHTPEEVDNWTAYCVFVEHSPALLPEEKRGKIPFGDAPPPGPDEVTKAVYPSSPLPAPIPGSDKGPPARSAAARSASAGSAVAAAQRSPATNLRQQVAVASGVTSALLVVALLTFYGVPRLIDRVRPDRAAGSLPADGPSPPATPLLEAEPTVPPMKWPEYQPPVTAAGPEQAVAPSSEVSAGTSSKPRRHRRRRQR